MPRRANVPTEKLGTVLLGRVRHLDGVYALGVEAPVPLREECRCEAVTSISETHTNWRCFGGPRVTRSFLHGLDRLVAFDAETTGKRTPGAESIPKQPFASRRAGNHHPTVCRNAARRRGLAQGGETWSSRVNRMGRFDPDAIKIHRIGLLISRTLHRFLTILPKVKTSFRDSPIVADAYKNVARLLSTHQLPGPR